MTAYSDLLVRLPATPKTWLITGVAGFIGCNLLETLLKLDQKVVGLDNFATGHRHNLKQIQEAVTPEQWARFQFIEGDIRKLDDCNAACAGVDYVLHQAALGSVPRSLEDPITTNGATPGITDSGLLRHAHGGIRAAMQVRKKLQAEPRLVIEAHHAVLYQRQFGDEFAIPAGVEGAHALLDKCIGSME